MVATSGDVLLAPDAIDAVRLRLIPRAALITPNIPEAATLLDVSPAQSESEMQTQAEALLELGCGAVLLKGGHAEGADAVDVFFDGSGPHSLRQPRIATHNTHGTGCTLSAAVAAYLVQGRSMEDAVVAAKAFVWNALESGARYAIGRGHGPVDHLFALKARPGS
jgi:hydroxymethylpyrimidine/phosphomethylpyrimidine kinase